LGLIIAVLVMAGTLSAQSDSVCNCRSRVAALTNVAFGNTSAHRRGGLPNGNDMILWKAKLSDGSMVTGLCEASPQSGRIVRLQADQDTAGINRAYRLTPGDAQRICAREARARFSPGNGMIGAFFLRNTSTRSTYRVEWRQDSMGGTIRQGNCEIDSATGRLRKFDANAGW